MNFLDLLKKNLLTLLTLVCVIVGVVLGVLLKTRQQPYSKRESMYIGIPGELFLRALSGVIIPLVVPSLICAIGSLDMRLAGRVGLRMFCYYFTTTVTAIVLGVILVVSIRPGKAREEGEVTETTKKRYKMLADILLDLLRNLLPPNVVEATMFQTNTELEYDEAKRKQDFAIHKEKKQRTNYLGLIVFSVVFGIAMAKADEEISRPILDVLQGVSTIMMTITRWIIYLAPCGVLFLVAGKIIEEDDYADLFRKLGMYVVTVLAGLGIHGLVVLPLLYFAFVRELPFRYIANLGKALMTAFATASSSATMPVTLNCLEDNNGLDQTITRFCIPVGATMNMDGTALYEAVAPIFIADTLGVELSFGNIVVIAITATFASIGAAGIPSAGLVTMVMVLDTVNISSEHVGIILAVDWLLDRFRTTVNVLGDCIGAGIVHHLSKADLEQTALTGPQGIMPLSSLGSKKGTGPFTPEHPSGEDLTMPAAEPTPDEAKKDASKEDKKTEEGKSKDKAKSKGRKSKKKKKRKGGGAGKTETDTETNMTEKTDDDKKSQKSGDDKYAYDPSRITRSGSQRPPAVASPMASNPQIRTPPTLSRKGAVGSRGGRVAKQKRPYPVGSPKVAKSPGSVKGPASSK